MDYELQLEKPSYVTKALTSDLTPDSSLSRLYVVPCQQ